MKIHVGHFYPEYLNIYADRGNIAVLSARAAARGHQIEVSSIGLGEQIHDDAVDLFYIGGGQDRDQRLVADDFAARSSQLADAVSGGAVVLGVCGGYQLLGRSYQDSDGGTLPGVGLLALDTVPGDRRLIGDVLVDCAWAGEQLAGFENHMGRTLLDPGLEPLGRVVAGYGNDGSCGQEGARLGRVYGTYLHGPLLPRNPWFADRLLSEALEHAGGAAVELDRLPDELERAAHVVAAARATTRSRAHTR